jgi:hypothetical protein
MDDRAVNALGSSHVGQPVITDQHQQALIGVEDCSGLTRRELEDFIERGGLRHCPAKLGELPQQSHSRELGTKGATRPLGTTTQHGLRLR